MSQSIKDAAASIFSSKAADRTNAAANEDVHKTRAEEGLQMRQQEPMPQSTTAQSNITEDSFADSKDPSFMQGSRRDGAHQYHIDSADGVLDRQQAHPEGKGAGLGERLKSKVGGSTKPLI